MKTHKHELMQYFKEANKVYFSHAINKKDVSDDMQKLSKIVNDSVYFYAGDASDIFQIKHVPELCAMPFDNMLIEFNYNLENTQMFYMLAVERCGLYVAKVYTYIRSYNGWHYYGHYFLNLMSGQRGEHGTFDGSISHEGKYGKIIISLTVTLLTCFLSCINCVNVKQVEHQANRQPGKASTSRKPLYSFWTLEIDKSKNQSMGIPLGGTHASPRIHLRRGHARQYKPGVYCWVQPCLVGKKEAGVIHKNYSLKAA